VLDAYYKQTMVKRHVASICVSDREGRSRRLTPKGESIGDLTPGGSLSGMAIGR